MTPTLRGFGFVIWPLPDNIDLLSWTAEELATFMLSRYDPGIGTSKK